MAYKSYSDIPWYERGAIGVGSAVEGVNKKIFDFFGMGDYAPSGFTDEKKQIKKDILNKGSSDGWDWETFGKGQGLYKVGDAIFGDDTPDAPRSSRDAISSTSGTSAQESLNLSGEGSSQGSSNQKTSLGRTIPIQQDIALKNEDF